MMVSPDILSTHRTKRQNKMSSAKGERKNRHPALITLDWWGKSCLWMEITWPNISKSTRKPSDGNTMDGSIWERQTTTGGKSCNYLQSKHNDYKGDEVVGKLALCIRPGMSSENEPDNQPCLKVWASMNIYVYTLIFLFTSSDKKTLDCTNEQTKWFACQKLPWGKKLWFLGYEEMICGIKMI